MIRIEGIVAVAGQLSDGNVVTTEALRALADGETYIFDEKTQSLRWRGEVGALPPTCVLPPTYLIEVV